MNNADSILIKVHDQSLNSLGYTPKNGITRSLCVDQVLQLIYRVLHNELDRLIYSYKSHNTLLIDLSLSHWCEYA